MNRIVVTGIGIISAIGNNVAKNRHALMTATCGISTSNHFASRYASLLPFGEIKISNEQLREQFAVSDKGITRTSLLALHAFAEAVESSGLNPGQIASADTAFISASTVGGMCLTDELYADAVGNNSDSPYLTSYDSAATAMFIQNRYGMCGLINTINTACSSSANAIMYGAGLIKNGLAKRAIVGGVDSLAKFTINGFNALHILSPDICTPFDAGRTGLNLGEGAAFLILEKQEDSTGKKIYGELAGYCNTNDSYHPSSLSENGEGPYLAMKGALDFAGLGADKIDFINAHGTGTENNDEVESKAMLRIFDKPPLFASTKSNTGHTLGAAGAIEAVYSLLTLEHQEIYPSLNFKNPIDSTGLSPLLEYKKMPVVHIMSNSFGFGGNCSSLIFSKV